MGRRRGGVGTATEQPAERPKGTVTSAELDRCIHLRDDRVSCPTPSATLPRCPSTVSIWACSPHPGHTCRARCACPQWHRLQPPLRRHPGFWCQQASGRQSGLSTPAVGLGSALRPAAQEPRMPLLTALGHRAAFPTAEPIDFW